MEKHRHIFEQFATFDNMYDGYLLARKHKRYQDCVLEYTNLLEDNLIDAVNRLQWHEYQTGPLHQFYEYYPKKRIISSLPFYDRVVNCARIQCDVADLQQVVLRTQLWQRSR